MRQGRTTHGPQSRRMSSMSVDRCDQPLLEAHRILDAAVVAAADDVFVVAMLAIEVARGGVVTPALDVDARHTRALGDGLEPTEHQAADSLSLVHGAHREQQ